MAMTCSQSNTLYTIPFVPVDFDQMTDSESSWLESMTNYTHTLQSYESVLRDALLRVHAKRLGAGEGTRLTRSMRDQVEDQVDKDMQAEYKAYHIATWEPGQLLPAFANHRKVLNEISSKSAEKEFRTTFAI